MSDDAKRELSDEQIDAACLAAWKAAGFIGRPVASNEWYRVTYLAGYRAAPAADAVKREGLSDEEVDAAVLAVKKRFGESVKWRMTSQSEVERVIYRAALAAPASVRAGSTIIMDGSTEGSVELRELQGAVQESLPAATARGNSSPAGVADTAEDFCGVPHDYSHRETRAGTAYRIAAWTCPTCAKRCSCMVLDGEHCHGDSLCIRFVDGVRTVHCGACWIADSPSPAAKVADALAELVACLAEQAAIPYGRTPDEAERAFNRRRANERRTERALTGGREALAAYLARPSCTYPACRCEGPGPDGGCGSAAIPSPDGAAG